MEIKAQFKTGREWVATMRYPETLEALPFNSLDEVFSSDEVIEYIVHWEGGIADTYTMKHLYEDAYGITLGNHTRRFI